MNCLYRTNHLYPRDSPVTVFRGTLTVPTLDDDFRDHRVIFYLVTVNNVRSLPMLLSSERR